MLPSSSQPGMAPALADNKITRGHSCVLCQRRKIKCDRERAKPCSNCVRSGAECIPSTSAAPRRRKRNLTEPDLISRLRRYEQLLKANGVKIEDDNDHGSSRGMDPSPEYSQEPASKGNEGTMFTKSGNSRYLENPLWESVCEEIENQKEVFPDASSEDELSESNLFPDPGTFLVSHITMTQNLKTLHPSPVTIFKLWQIFLTNANPLIKIFHSPTVQIMIIDASENLEQVPKSTEALMFSIYLLAVVSLTTEECEAMFSETRDSLISKYAGATQQALVNAKFLKSSNLVTLQAFSIYLLSSRQHYDPQSFWILTGMAARIAQRLGLHRNDSSHNLSLLETEIRRRTLWQVAFLDSFASKISGAGYCNVHQWLSAFEMKLPLNISDCDLNPNMVETPRAREGASEMIFCSVRYEVAIAMKNAGAFSQKSASGGWSLTDNLSSLSEKDKSIDELETRLYEKYIQYCDASVPFHLMTITLAKSIICILRIIAHHPKQYLDKGINMPQKEKDILFDQCLKSLEYDTLQHESKLLSRFSWHTNGHYQIDSFIYLISELRRRTSGEMVDRAWQLIEKAYTYRPEMITRSKNILYFAIGNLTLKAWAQREESGLLNRGANHLTLPRFISLLRSQRQQAEQSQPPTKLDGNEPPRTPNGGLATNYSAQVAPEYHPAQIGDEWANTDLNFNSENSLVEATPMDWEYWQSLLDGDFPAYNIDLS